MSYQSALNAINTNIVENHSEYITGVILNSVLLEMLEYVRDVVGDEAALTSFNNLIQAVEELKSDIENVNESDLNDVVLRGNITTEKISGSSFFSNKDENDFAQMQDIANATGGVFYFGEFNSVADIEILQGNEGDLAVLNYASEKYLFQLYFDGWRAVNGLFINGLKIKKQPNNLNGKIIQHMDKCEGWISPNLFVKGLWKGADNPTLSQLQDKNNWSEFIEIE